MQCPSCGTQAETGARYLGSSEAVKKTAPIREMSGIGGKGKERLRERIIGDDVVNVEAKISG